MKRRALLLGSAAAALLRGLPASGQSTGRIHRLGAFLPMAGLAAAPYLEALRRRLAEHGFEEGRNLTLEPHYLSTRSEVRALDQSRYDVVFVCTSFLTEPVLAQKSATPVVFAWIADPVAWGFVKSLARPEGRATGVRNRYYELTQKRLELLREMLPSAKRVGAATTTLDAVAQAILEHAREAAARLGLELFGIDAPMGFGAALRKVAAAGADAVLVLIPFAEYGMRFAAEETVQFMLEHKMPMVFSDSESVELGGLISYAIDLTDSVRRAADLIARILRGAHPGAIAVDQAARFHLAVNLKSARAIGVEIPRSILVRADQVLE